MHISGFRSELDLWDSLHLMNFKSCGLAFWFWCNSSTVEEMWKNWCLMFVGWYNAFNMLNSLWKIQQTKIMFWLSHEKIMERNLIQLECSKCKGLSGLSLTFGLCYLLMSVVNFDDWRGSTVSNTAERETPKSKNAL